MSRRLEALQWFALFGGALAWTGQFVVGFGIGEAVCSEGGSGFGVDGETWQTALFVAAAVVTVLAELAAVVVLRATEFTDYEGDPPPGRWRFFALAAAAANVLFLALILNTGLMSLEQLPCRQS